MSNPTVKIYNIHPNILYDWFYTSAAQSCGDGCSFLYCGNPSETATDFIRYWTNRYEKDFPHPRDEYWGLKGEMIINFHDDNENFMFCDTFNPPIYPEPIDVNFVVMEDCYIYNLVSSTHIIKAIKNEVN